MRKRRKILRYLVLLLAGLVFLTGIGLYEYIWIGRRFYIYAPYAHASWYCHENNIKLSTDIAEFETLYMNSGEARGDIPPLAPWKRPIFRPLEDDCLDVHYLMFIEPEPAKSLGLSRLLIYVTPEGFTQLEYVWYWQIDDLIQQDDALRKRACKQESGRDE